MHPEKRAKKKSKLKLDRRRENYRSVDSRMDPLR